AWAVYYLGMLAGRGVDYDRIHKVLLDYARNDQEPNVRQWAVEGLRFLGKDEVVDELFTSFTQDPSMNVRDRAGCNISDCGVFTRKQRMRMVPKFIELDRKSTRLNSSHLGSSYAVFCLKKKKMRCHDDCQCATATCLI